MLILADARECETEFLATYPPGIRPSFKCHGSDRAFYRNAPGFQPRLITKLPSSCKASSC